MSEPRIAVKNDAVAPLRPEIVRGLVSAGIPVAVAQAQARVLSETEAESSRALMQRLFPGVPVIYGFSSLAPYGRVSGPMLERFFAAGGGDDVGSGRASDKLLAIFGPASMTVASGASGDGAAPPGAWSSGPPMAGITRVSSPLNPWLSPPPARSPATWFTPGSSSSAAIAAPRPDLPCRPAADADDTAPP